MKSTSKKVKLFSIAAVLTIAASLFAFLGFGRKTASAAEMTPDRGNYEGYADAPSGDWYNGGDIQVSDAPVITVLTHGLGASAYHWSNNFKSSSGEPFGLAYDSRSLIEQLRTNAPDGANVYWANMTSAARFRLMELPVQGQLERYYDNAPPTDAINGQLPTILRLTIEDLQKHIVIVFDALDSTASNEAVHDSFSAMLDRIVCDYAHLTGGTYPKINLIGHSRGGITNLQYALEYPRLIAGLYSLGTPYMGTTAGQVNRMFGHFVVENTEGFRDIMSRDVWSEYRDTWNSGYQASYSHIDAVMFGGYSTLGYLVEMFNHDHDGMFTPAQEFGMKVLFTAVGTLSPLTEGLLTSLVPDALHGLFPDADILALTHLLANELDFSLSDMNMVLHNDLFVDLDSQLGRDNEDVSYTGFERITKIFNAEADFDRISEAELPIVHNLEARDSDIIEEIVSRIDTGAEPPFDTTDLPDNKIRIDRFNYKDFSGTFAVPGALGGKTVTEIGDSAFAASGFSEAVIPSSITEIGDYAFASCTGLTGEGVKIQPASQLETIGLNAFYNCSGLTEITIPASVTSIYSGAFMSCTGLTGTGVTFAAGSALAVIGARAFAGCVNLTDITIPAGVENIYDGAFSGCTSLSGGGVAFVSGDRLARIGADAFSGCLNLTEIDIPSSVTEIGSYAFLGCSGLTEMTVPDAVTVIGRGAFQGTSLESIILPFVGRGIGTTLTAFGYIFGAGNYVGQNGYVPETLKTVTVTGTRHIAENTFNGCTNLTGINIPNAAGSIGYAAFFGCTGLTGIAIPSGITAIGANAFKDCTNLRTVNVGRTATANITTADASSFANCPLSAVLVPNSASVTAYKNAAGWSQYSAVIYNVSAVVTPDFTYSLDGAGYTVSKGSGTLRGTIQIPASFGGIPVTAIADNGFANCADMTDVTVPGSVTSIGLGAFAGCTRLISITLPFAGNTSNGTSNTHFGYIFGAPVYSGQNTYVPQSIQMAKITGGKIASYAFSGLVNPRLLTIQNVTEIGSNAFASSGFFSITLPAGLRVIEAGTFSGSSIIGISIPNGVTTIGTSAFYGCRGLSGITIPDSVTRIHLYAFYGCTGLSNVTISSNLTEIESNTFENCSNLRTVTIRRPSSMGVTALVYNALRNCPLTAIYVPDSASVTAYKAAPGWSQYASIIRTV